MNNVKLKEFSSNKDFRWSNQNNWKSRCNHNFMQSPVDIAKNLTSLDQKLFSFNYIFYDAYPIVQRRFNEAVIRFSNNAGLVKVNFGLKTLIFKPTSINFRFRGEHTFEGRRNDGELQINLKQLNPDKKQRELNGLMISIPLEGKKENPNAKVLESLGFDFWKYSLFKNNTHIPIDYFTKQRSILSLSDIINQVKSNNTDYSLYLGSETRPPCSEYVLHLVFRNPLQISLCQLKVIRENTLLVQGFKEIHTRMTQRLNGRKVRVLRKLKFNPAIESEIPNEWYELSQELYGEDLLLPKLDTIGRYKAAQLLKKGFKKGGLIKKGKKGKRIRNGVPLNSELFEEYFDEKEYERNPEYRRRFAKYARYFKKRASGHAGGLDGSLNC